MTETVEGLTGQCRATLSKLCGGGVVEDDEFDRLFPRYVRALSAFQWSPVAVAARAASLLVTDSTTRVLDVGCGPGKFCFIGALTTPGHFYGIEQRDHLVIEGETIRTNFDIPRVSLIHGNMTQLDWHAFDAFYFFNPFYENIAAFAQIDGLLPANGKIFVDYVEFVRSRLLAARIGTRVAAYQGFGGTFPEEYEMTHSESAGSDVVELWLKTR